MRYFDAHSHVQFSQYDGDRDAVLAGMREAGVGTLIVGTDKSHSEQAVAVADGKTLFASIGLHPNDKPNEGYDDAFFRELAKNEKVVAIGECGLDYFRPDEPEAEKARQREAFLGQIRIAGETGKPLVIHARPSKGTMDAYEDAFELLKEAKREFGNLRGDMHFFVGNTDIAKKYLELDFTFSFTAVITFSRDYDEVVRYIPRTHLLSETDAPYVAPAPNRGKRNVPLAVREVVRALAEIRGEEEEVVREATVRNAKGLFGLP